MAAGRWGKIRHNYKHITALDLKTTAIDYTESFAIITKPNLLLCLSKIHGDDSVSAVG